MTNLNKIMIFDKALGIISPPGNISPHHQFLYLYEFKFTFFNNRKNSVFLYFYHICIYYTNTLYNYPPFDIPEYYKNCLVCVNI